MDNFCLVYLLFEQLVFGIIVLMYLQTIWELVLMEYNGQVLSNQVLMLYQYFPLTFVIILLFLLFHSIHLQFDLERCRFRALYRLELVAFYFYLYFLLVLALPLKWIAYHLVPYPDK